MSLPQISLRTLLWILFAAAIATGWGWERWENVSELDRLASARSFNHSFFSGAVNPQWSAAKLAMIERLSKLSDPDLREELIGLEIIGTTATVRWPWLMEMARRGMAGDLRAELDTIAKRGVNRSRANADVYTALRLAEHKADPVAIDIKFVAADAEGKPTPTLYVAAFVRNADVDRESFRFSWDRNVYLLGRDRWRMVFRDEQGNRLPDSNFVYVYSEIGQSKGESEFKFGQSCENHPTMDPRRYVSPPPSGRYQLQLHYSETDIIDAPDFDGGIVWKSAPLWVEVVNRDADRFDFTLIRLGLVIGLAIGVIVVTRAVSPPRTGDESIFVRYGDLAACALIIALAVGWWFDNRQLRESIAEVRPHSEADWTIVEPKANR